MKKYIFSALLLCIYSSALVSAEELSPFELSLPKGVQEGQFYKVWRVVDGDTIRLSNDKRVVLNGIDAPEYYMTQKMFNLSRERGETMKNIKIKGKMAKNYLSQLVEGQWVALQFDKRKRDSRGQILAYIYLQDGTFVNAELVKEGYARAATFEPNTLYDPLFQELQDEAKENKRGLWEYGL